MKVMQLVPKHEEEIVDYICNKCGNSCEKGEASVGSKDFYGLLETEVVGGYLSDPLEDLTTYTFSICETCLKELFDSFKIPVEKFRLA